MTCEEITQVQLMLAEQCGQDRDSISAAKHRLYTILSQPPQDNEARQLLRQICQKYPSNFVEHKQDFLITLEQKYQGIYEKVINLAALGWQYCLGLDEKFIAPELPVPQRQKRRAVAQEVILPKAPHTASEYLDQILSISDIQARWHYVNQLVNTPNELLLADDFADICDPELSNCLQKTLGGGRLNILILGAGCVGLAFAHVLKTSCGELVNILMIENRIQAQHIKQPYTRNWLTNLSNVLYEDFFDPRVVKILHEFGNGQYMGVPLNILETLLFLANRAQGVHFYFDDQYQLSLINETDIDMVVDATGGNLNIIDASYWDDGTFIANLPGSCQLGSKYSGFGITKVEDLPPLSLKLQKKGAFFYPYLAEKQLKSAMFKLTDVPLELYEHLLMYVKADNSDSLIYVWPGKLRKELNSLLILINLSVADYQEMSQISYQKMSLDSFMNEHGNNLHLDPRILGLFQQIIEHDTHKNAHIEPPFFYEPRMRTIPEKLPRIFGRPIFWLGDSVFTGHPKVGNGLGSHLDIIGKLHDVILAFS